VGKEDHNFLWMVLQKYKISYDKDANGKNLAELIVRNNLDLTYWYVDIHSQLGTSRASESPSNMSSPCMDMHSQFGTSRASKSPRNNMDPESNAQDDSSDDKDSSSSSTYEAPKPQRKVQ